MILPALIRHHLKYKDDAEFYRMQAVDAIQWLKKKNVPVGRGIHALDLGCGHGVFGLWLSKQGCEITFADEENFLLPALQNARFIGFNIDREELDKLGTYDLVICSNVLEHLSRPKEFLASIHKFLKPSGYF